MITSCLLSMLVVTGVPALENPPREFCEDENRCADDGIRIVFTESADVTEFDKPAEIASLGSVLGPTPVGTEFTAVVVLDVVSEPIRGWTFGVEHDTGKLQVLEAASVELPPAFDSPLKSTRLAVPEPGQPAPGFVSFATFCGIAGCFGELPLGPNLPLAFARYRVIAPIDGTTRLKFSNELIPAPGFPPTWTVFTIGSDSRKPRFVVDGLIDGRSTRFRRGDMNGDRDIDLSDLVVLLRHLFLGGPVLFDCERVLDMNDDGAIDVSDPVALINWRFRGTLAFPTAVVTCVPTPETGLECRESNCSELR